MIRAAILAAADAFAAVAAATAAIAVPASRSAFQAKVKIAKVDDQKIAWYERWRSGPARRLAEWDPALLRLLAEDHRLIMFDYPGIGLSSPLRAKSKTSFSGLALRVVAVPEGRSIDWDRARAFVTELASRTARGGEDSATDQLQDAQDTLLSDLTFLQIDFDAPDGSPAAMTWAFAGHTFYAVADALADGKINLPDARRRSREPTARS